MILVAAQNVPDKGLLYPHRAGSSLLSGKLYKRKELKGVGIFWADFSRPISSAFKKTEQF